MSISWKKFSLIAVSTIMFGSCDVMEKDADANVVTVDNKPAYFISNSTGFIDLSARVKAPGKVKIELSDLTRKGELKDLGKGLLQYTPFGGRNSSRDSFRFSIVSESGNIIGADTIGIIVGDSTTLPCAIYARNDYAYNSSGVVTVDVLSNDVVCSGTTTLSINTDTPPAVGTATVVSNKIAYTPGAGFNGKDKVVYKVTSSDNSIAPAFGMLYISSSGSCEVLLRNDEYVQQDNLQRRSTIIIDALANDQLCTGSFQQFSILITPLQGKAAILNNKIVYTAPDTIRGNTFYDDFRYQYCVDAVCKEAMVTIRAGGAPCTLLAINDAFDISQNEIPVMLFDVLGNDRVCNMPPALTIVTPTQFGTAVVSADGKTIQYTRDPSHKVNDSFTYKICAGPECSMASAAIEQQ